ncbi:MAG TPA: GDSL-type esterase/lipase family protein [Chitinophagaceae bacterium]|nr:GDSL-type esterase/lipase family protein [Chitinophagaceae bacterium]
MTRIVCLCIVSIFIIAQRVYAQHPPFWNDIQNFKKQDSIKPPPQNAILFVGSSSFTKWTDVQSYFPDHTIINRGFGGSTLADVIRYAGDVIFPYHPKQVVIYCGENDFAYSDTVAVSTVVNRFKELFNIIRNKMPGENIVFISMKPSPSRKKFWPKMIEGNKEIHAFLAKHKNTSFVDVFPLMLVNSHQAIPSIFLNDSLHMNASGYAIWQKVIEPVLVK